MPAQTAQGTCSAGWTYSDDANETSRRARIASTSRAGSGAEAVEQRGRFLRGDRGGKDLAQGERRRDGRGPDTVQDDYPG